MLINRRRELDARGVFKEHVLKEQEAEVNKGEDRVDLKLLSVSIDIVLMCIHLHLLESN